MKQLPSTGMKEAEVIEKLEALRSNDLDWRTGKILGYVYDAGADAEKIGKQAYMMYLTENGLDPTVFQSLLQMENDIVAIAAAHLNGDQNVVGNFTTGGTESILMAVKTAREYFRAKKPEIEKPEMILPTTAHAAFHKAAAYFDVTIVPVPVDDKTFRPDPDKMSEAIGPSTILLVASAPSYAHGVIDPIAEIGKLAQQHELLFHVDACVGGWMLPYFQRQGQPVPEFDFRVPGVTSMSMDLHKYAYTPKNASLVLYRDKSIRLHQIFACAAWPGYSIVNATAQSSKTGGPLAAAWAVLHFIGDDGYLDIARTKLEATRHLAREISAMPDWELMAEPDFCMFSIRSDTIDIFQMIDVMRTREWYIQPQLSFQNSRRNIHISLSASNAGLVEPFLADFRECTEIVKSGQAESAGGGLLDAVADVDFENLTDAEIASFIELVGIGGDADLGQMAEINTILDACPVEVRRRLMCHFINEIFNQR